MIGSSSGAGGPILDSAWKSARDGATFQNHRKAFELLKTLVTSYWRPGPMDVETRST